ncbi:MAG TPA: DUF4129 domain-containing protein [Vicinamibacteria bacterium]|nr:DUF4129 domain-containing protein [Vicinamibacteria bacterium]
MSAARPPAAGAALASARSLALYGLSLSAGAGVALAWPGQGDPTLGIAGAALGLAAAQVLGDGLSPWLEGTLGPRARLKARSWVGVLYAGTVLLGLALVALEPKLLRPAGIIFLLLQGLFLMGGPSLGGEVLGVANAFVLVFLVSFRGGLVAAACVTGSLGLLVFFLTLDHFTRQLSWYPHRDVSLTGAALRQAAAVAAPLVLGLSLFFALYPPAPYSRLPLPDADPATRSEQVAQAYRRLVLLAIAGGACVFLATRLFRRAPGEEPPREELVEPQRGQEEALPSPPNRRRAYPGTRGRVVRAYLRVLSQGPRFGLRLRASLTPRQIEAHLRHPAAALATLTTLFQQARYGPEEPGEADAREAEAAAGSILARPRSGTVARRAGRVAGG